MLIKLPPGGSKTKSRSAFDKKPLIIVNSSGLKGPIWIESDMIVNNGIISCWLSSLIGFEGCMDW